MLKGKIETKEDLLIYCAYTLYKLKSRNSFLEGEIAKNNPALFKEKVFSGILCNINHFSTLSSALELSGKFPEHKKKKYIELEEEIKKYLFE